MKNSSLPPDVGIRLTSVICAATTTESLRTKRPLSHGVSSGQHVRVLSDKYMISGVKSVDSLGLSSFADLSPSDRAAKVVEMRGLIKEGRRNVRILDNAVSPSLFTASLVASLGEMDAHSKRARTGRSNSSRL